MTYKIQKTKPLVNGSLIFLLIGLCWLYYLTFGYYITFDGHYYFGLSRYFSSGGEWDIARTPIYPALLHIVRVIPQWVPDFALLNYLILTIIFSLFIKICKNLSLALIAFLVYLLLPSTITYANGLLTETLLSFTLVMIYYAATKIYGSHWSRYLGITVALVISYYIKPSFKIFGLWVFFGLFLFDVVFTDNKTQRVRFTAIIMIALSAFLLFTEAWDSQLRKSGRLIPLNLFPLIMGVVPAEAKYIGNNFETYQQLIRENQPIGRAGLSHDKVYPFVGNTNVNLHIASIKDNTSKYLLAALKSLSVYVVSAETNSENHAFYNSIQPPNDNHKSVKLYHFTGDTGLRGLVNERYLRDWGYSLQKNYIKSLFTVTEYLRSLLLLGLPIILFISIKHRYEHITFCIWMLVGYLLMHGLSLMAIDRYSVPVDPLLVLTYVLYLKKILVVNTANNS